MWILIAVGAGVLALAHTAPVPFLFDAIARGRSVWHMPRVPAACGLAQLGDVRRAETDRSPDGRLELDAVGLELVPRAHGRLGREPPARSRLERRHHRHA